MDLFSSLSTMFKKPTGNSDSEMKFKQGSEMTRSKFLSSNFGGREWITKEEEARSRENPWRQPQSLCEWW